MSRVLAKRWMGLDGMAVFNLIRSAKEAWRNYRLDSHSPIKPQPISARPPDALALSDPYVEIMSRLDMGEPVDATFKRALDGSTSTLEIWVGGKLAWKIKAHTKKHKFQIKA